MEGAGFEDSEASSGSRNGGSGQRDPGSEAVL